MKTTKSNNPVKDFKQIESLIKSAPGLTNDEKKDLSMRNIFALIANCEIVE